MKRRRKWKTAEKVGAGAGQKGKKTEKKTGEGPIGEGLGLQGKWDAMGGRIVQK